MNDHPSDSQFKIMGIVNITPDSFSDGGNYNNQQALLLRIRELSECGSDSNGMFEYFDIGAESTAPMNRPISEEEEWERWQQIFFPVILESGLLSSPNKSIKSIKSICLSVDTYRPEIFFKVYNQLKHLGRIGIKKFIWNDISGAIDERLINLLKEKQRNDEQQWEYVLTYNRAGVIAGREVASEHMKYCLSEDKGRSISILSDAIDFFKSACSRFSSEGINVSQKIIFDPGFGFAKSREQNIYLVENFSKLVLALPSMCRWLVGISRKSFLRDVNEVGKRDSKIILKCEELHSTQLSKWRQEFLDKGISSSVIFRVHDPQTAIKVLGC